MIEGSGREGMARRLAVFATIGAALALLAGCGGADDDTPANAQASPKATIVLTDGAYDPAKVEIEVGDRVTFVNGSQAANTAETDGAGFFEYDATKLDRENQFDLHTLQPGEAGSVEFDTPGVYQFHSSLNSAMKGVVDVAEPRG